MKDDEVDQSGTDILVGVPGGLLAREGFSDALETRSYFSFG